MTGGTGLDTSHYKARVAFEIKARLGEGPVWDIDLQRLYWVDIEERKFHRFYPEKGENRSVAMPDMVSAVALTRTSKVLCAFSKDLTLMSEDGDIGQVIHSMQDEPLTNRYNDGKCDTLGRFWIGSMSKIGTPRAGAIYRLDADGSLTRMISDVCTSNGLGWSPDNKTMYHTDSPLGEIHAFDFDLEAGAISNSRLFARIPSDQGRPDGLTVDTQGGVWSAHWGGGCVTRYLPNGTVDRVIEMPVPRPTSVIFGGRDFSTLFVTSARIDLTHEELKNAPLSGSIFSIETDYVGLPTPRFDDRQLA
jgi:sugar lactone lactonase YvrE